MNRKATRICHGQFETTSAQHLVTTLHAVILSIPHNPDIRICSPKQARGGQGPKESFGDFAATVVQSGSVLKASVWKWSMTVMAYPQNGTIDHWQEAQKVYEALFT